MPLPLTPSCETRDHQTDDGENDRGNNFPDGGYNSRQSILEWTDLLGQRPEASKILAAIEPDNPESDLQLEVSDSSLPR